MTAQETPNFVMIGDMMHIDDLMWLYETAKRMNSIAEIGCWKGCSTSALLLGCPGTVYAIDNWIGSAYARVGLHQRAKERDIHVDFMANVGHFKNLVVKKMSSMDAVKEFEDKSVDMVFIDGEHFYEYVLDDIKCWLPKTVKLLCGHDIAHKPVARAAKELLGEYKVTKQNIWYKEL